MALQTITPANSYGPFRRNGKKQPLVIQGPIGTRTGPFTHADEAPYYRASGVKSLLEDATGVNTWKVNGSMWAVGHDEGLRLSVAAVDDFESPEGKARMRDLREQAEHKSGMTAKREGGTALHGLFARIDRGEPLPPTIAPEHRHAIEAYTDIRQLFVVHEIELTVVCDPLAVGGNLDKIVSPRAVMVPRDRKGRQFAPEVTPDQRVVGDVKAAQNPDYFGAFALQLAPYACGVAYREEEDPTVLARQRDEGVDEWSQEARLARVKAVHRAAINVRTDVALLIHVPFKGAHAELFWFDLVQGYAAAQHAMRTRELRGQFRGMFAPAELPVVAEAQTRTVEVSGGALEFAQPQPVSRATFAGQIFDTVKTAHDYRKLMELIGQCPTETALLELYRTNWRIWTETHTARAGERSVFLAQKTAS